MKTKLLFRICYLISLMFSNIIFAQWSTDPNFNNPICTGNGIQYRLSQVTDGAGGSVMVWTDNRNGNADIYAQRISANGYPMWGTNGIVICNAADTQDFPTIIASDLNSVIIAWIDLRTGIDYNIYAQKISLSGTTLWTSNGVPICTSPSDQTEPSLADDGFGGAYLAWTDARFGAASTDLYYQRINSTGVVQWATDGVILEAYTNKQRKPKLVSSINTTYFNTVVIWEDNRNSASGWDIYAKVLPGSSNAPAIAICTANGLQRNAQLISDYNGGAIITWQDGRSGTYEDIYAQRIVGNNTTQWTSNGVVVCDAYENQTFPKIVYDGNHGAIICWDDMRNVATDGRAIYAQRLDANGTHKWLLMPNGMPVADAIGTPQTYPNIVTDNAGGAIITWAGVENSTEINIYAERILYDFGVGQWGTNATVCSVAGEQMLPQIVADNSGGAIIAWTDLRSGIGFDDIFAQRINSGGTLANNTNNFENKKFTIYPNPSTNGEFSVQSKTPIQSIVAFDVLGKQIDVEKNNDSYKINASNGIYTLKIIDSEGNTQNLKLIIK